MAITVGSGAVMSAASRRNSVTFDEPHMIAAGARAVATGDITMGFDQPPGMFYVFGAAVSVYSRVARFVGAPSIRLPSEVGTYDLDPAVAADMPPWVRDRRPFPRWGLYNRYDYARAVFFEVGNDPERLALVARIANVLLTMTLALCLALFVLRRFGPVAAIFTTSIFVFLPDVLAHAGVAYNDIGVALAFFVGVWAVDLFIRRPTIWRGLVAGSFIGVALAIKFSALILGPVAIVLWLAEGTLRRFDRPWLLSCARGVVAGAVGAYVILFVVYRGDATLIQFRFGIREQLVHSGGGHGVPAVLLGRQSYEGFWYFFPVVLALKTTLALHALLILSAIGFAVSRTPLRGMLASPTRPLVASTVVFLAVLMGSNLDIGVRYALPLAPMIAGLLGVGLSRLWRRRSQVVRIVVAALLIANASLALIHYPWFLSYVTELVPPESRLTSLADSNRDWGQGLLALRDLMEREHIDGLYLAYFGSALPEGYHIRYWGLPSWRPLPQSPPPNPPYEWIAISATLLNGLYEVGDPFARFRLQLPDFIAANTIYVYRLR